MSHINDLILEKTGGLTINDGKGSWFGQTAAETLNDAEYRWLSVDKAQPAGSINDMWFTFLRASGYTGTLIDMLFSYWGSPSIFSLPLSSIGADGTFVRATPATVIDHDGVIRKVLSGETRFQKQRRVYNEFADGLANSEDLTTLTNPTALNDIVTATTVELTAVDSSYCYFDSPNTYPIGSKVLVRAKVQWISGATSVGFRLTEAAAASDIEAVIDLSDGLEHVITLNLTMVSAAIVQLGVDNRSAVVGGVDTGVTKILFTELQIQDKSGASDPTIPDDYVSAGVLTSPYHGVNVDGVKCFLTANGNTVLANVVTAGVGVAITDAIGYFLEIGRTNKGTCYNAIPNSGAFAPAADTTFNANTTNLIAAGALASFGVVTDAAELALAGLDGLCPSGLVYKIITAFNAATIDVVGPVGNINPHVLSVWARKTAGTATLQLTGTAGSTAITSASYNRLSFSATPAGTGNILRIAAAINTTVYFILPQLEEGAFITSEIITAGATAARNKDDLTFPTTSLPANDCVFDFDWTPTAALQGALSLVGSYLDASNDVVTYMNSSTNVFVRKKVAGVLFEANKSLTYVAGTTYSIKGRYDSVLGVDIWIDNVKGVNVSNTADLAYGASLNIGYYHSGSALWQTGGINNFKIHSGNFSDAQVVAL